MICVVRRMCPDQAVRTVLEAYADSVPHAELARDFLEYRRWSGDEPLLFVAEAAAASTGQGFVDGIKPTVERFRDAFVATDRVDSLSALAALDREDEALVAALGAQRKREVLLEVARALAGRPEADDLAALVGWAATADHYRYDGDSIGSISGVGLATFQYLRQLAGIDTPRPDPTAERLLEAVDADLEDSPIDTSTNRRTTASCEWLAFVSDYGPSRSIGSRGGRPPSPADREAILEAARD